MGGPKGDPKREHREDEEPLLFDLEELRIHPVNEPEPFHLRTVISRWAEANDIQLIFFDPPEHFDHAIVGVIQGFGQAVAVCYDAEQVLAAMIAGGMTREDAEEWFEFNTIGAYVGEATPRFLSKPWEEEGPNVEKT